MWSTFYDRWMHFIGLQNLNSHSLPLKSLEGPGQFFKYSSDCICLKKGSHTPRMAWGLVNHRVLFIFGWTLLLKQGCQTDFHWGPLQHYGCHQMAGCNCKTVQTLPLLNILLNNCLFILLLATYLSDKYCICICIDVKIYVFITLCYFNKYFSFIRLRNPHYFINQSK